MPRYRRNLQKNNSKKAYQLVKKKTDKLETREHYHHPEQSREMSDRRTRHYKEVDRVLL